MLLEIIALATIALGIFLVFRGLTESPYEIELPEPEIEPDFKEEELERRKRRKKTEMRAGGVVLIGPIPIVFGESRMAVYALILTIILMLMVLLFMFAPYWR